MDNNCLKYYLDSIMQCGVMARTQMFYVCDLDFGDMTICRHDTPFYHREWFEISPRSNMAVRSYDSDTDFGYVSL